MGQQNGERDDASRCRQQRPQFSNFQIFVNFDFKIRYSTETRVTCESVGGAFWP